MPTKNFKKTKPFLRNKRKMISFDFIIAQGTFFHSITKCLHSKMMKQNVNKNKQHRFLNVNKVQFNDPDFICVVLGWHWGCCRPNKIHLNRDIPQTLRRRRQFPSSSMPAGMITLIDTADGRVISLRGKTETMWYTCRTSIHSIGLTYFQPSRQSQV